jgi:hypothetical protein
MQQSELIDQLEDDLRHLLEHVRTAVAPKSIETLAERTDPMRWNTIETLAHLNALWADYLPGMERAIHKAKARSWTPQGPVRYTFFGRRALLRADPHSGKAYRSRKAYNFFQKPVDSDPVKTFIIGAEKMQRLLQQARGVDLNKTTVPVASAWFGSYTLGNLMAWLVLHAHKHLL